MKKCDSGKSGLIKGFLLGGSVFLSGVSSSWAYDLPVLPPMPTVASAPANSMPMGNPAVFPEVQMDFSIETSGPFQPAGTPIAANVRVNAKKQVSK